MLLLGGLLRGQCALRLLLLRARRVELAFRVGERRLGRVRARLERGLVGAQLWPVGARQTVRAEQSRERERERQTWVG
jgi:hypothetical protein